MINIKWKIRLNTITDIQKFVETISIIEEEVFLENDNGLKLSAKNVLEAVLSVEWKDVYCVCDKDISTLIQPWITKREVRK